MLEDMFDPDEIVQYIIVNSDLKMSKGKVAAQVAHGAVNAIYFSLALETHDNETRRWLDGSHTKIILKATEEQLNQIRKKPPSPYAPIFDEGRTQIKKGSLTCIAFYPDYKSNFPEEIRTLKLL